nr:Chain B, GUANINE NUCLEOTIDE-BINDING PROTEIN G(T) SUBUNIT ALPHA-1 [Bos taurus]3DQB_B Chain B, 11meric peptide form Guanine nucleotide-binding protein G(t) subunit alpha-1 [synthetic construct]4A4M_B Chain B, GUANINE NUCLEOTIDE-BINDING PROTEIN G(T) SUBUNIT ALPHA-3 [Bos taurus]4BEY_B Chain B, Guanine nucleotide-binding protein G(t) subunit alpha-1 [Bos taurus]
ILENLKDCGLF